MSIQMLISTANLACLPIYLWPLVSNLLCSHIPSIYYQYHYWFSAPRQKLGNLDLHPHSLPSPVNRLTPCNQPSHHYWLLVNLLPSIPNTPGLCQVLRNLATTHTDNWITWGHLPPELIPWSWRRWLKNFDNKIKGMSSEDVRINDVRFFHQSGKMVAWESILRYYD